MTLVCMEAQIRLSEKDMTNITDRNSSISTTTLSTKYLDVNRAAMKIEAGNLNSELGNLSYNNDNRKKLEKTRITSFERSHTLENYEAEQIGINLDHWLENQFPSNIS